MGKTINLLITLILFYQAVFSQHLEEKTFKSAIEITFEKNLDIDDTVSMNFNTKCFERIQNSSIVSEFDFHKHLRQDQYSFFAVGINLNKLILQKDSILDTNYKSRSNVYIMSVTECKFNNVEKVYCIKLKETQEFIYNDNLTSIILNYHYFWYSEFFTNYYVYYAQSILHTPEGIVISYNENLQEIKPDILKKSFTNKANNKICVYPNPVDQEYFTLRYISGKEELISISVIDATGRLCKDYKFKSITGLNTFKCETTRLQKGFYFLQANINNTDFSQKIIIE